MLYLISGMHELRSLATWWLHPRPQLPASATPAALQAATPAARPAAPCAERSRPKPCRGQPRGVRRPGMGMNHGPMEEDFCSTSKW